MIRQTYIEFIEKFEELSPYEINHLCKIMHQQYQIFVKTPANKKRASLKPSDVQEIIVRSVHSIQVELAEKRLKQAETALKRVKERTPKKAIIGC